MVRSLLTVLLVSITLHSETNDVLNPNSDAYTFSLESFRAEYVQMGNRFDITTSFSPDESVYNIMMSMPDISNPNRMITDVIGLSSLNGAFIYRNFHSPMPNWTYNKSTYLNDSVVLKEYSKLEMKEQVVESKNPVFDGTFAYWQLAGIDNSEKSFSLNRWRKTANGVEVGASAVFENDRNELVTINGRSFNCRVFVVELGNGDTLTSYTADEPPYLIKQDYQTNGQEINLIFLVKLLIDE
ncbi:MAG: hypothetical protein JJ971_01500 [Balneolaceae bacterium]|nr:hypothetical protein [Balneolaceae bacterium]MBO6545047.1 hypothetical protein [Balneolaceae bacterium]MBO6646443.1 hypothetical protein [Balneolaceae bacterium]